jgi:AAA+ superfamily predicted ATPase
MTEEPAMSDAMKHLRLRLRPLHRALAVATRRRSHDIDRLAKGDAEHIGSDHVGRWLAALDASAETGRLAGEPAVQTREEEHEEAELRDHARELPLDVITREAALDLFEQEVLLLCTAVELDPRYGSVFAFLQDDLTRRRPTVGFLVGITAMFGAELPVRRRALGRLGKLRRYQLLRAVTATSEIDEELVLAPRVLDALLGTARFEPRDPLELQPANTASVVNSTELDLAARAMQTGSVSVVGIWGARTAGHQALVRGLASRLRVRVRTLPRTGEAAALLVRDTASDAEALGQLLWIDEEVLAAHPELLGELIGTRARVCLTGEKPHRSAKLLATRAYTEVSVEAPSYSERRATWLAAIEDLDARRAADLAARYRLGPEEVVAIARTARTAALLASNGHAASPADFVEAACAMLVQTRSQRLASVVKPRRGLADLVLAPDLEHQIRDLVQAFRAWPRLVENWGLSRVASGGLKALFAGEPGTGKTLAAEAITHELGLALVKIDLAQVVSKWVGETEKNLDIVFREAEHGNAVLFFDEAEALFGKRGEVRHGTDRYANLEVSYLLQRLEDHDGLVLLASNLKGEIDEAFTRRFHAVLYFQRPGEVERLRLWALALPPSVPLADEVDLGLLARLELTGAGIVAAVRSAALHAAQADADRIRARDLVFGVARQFQREARLLTATDLGRYGELLRPS